MLCAAAIWIKQRNYFLIFNYISFSQSKLKLQIFRFLSNATNGESYIKAKPNQNRLDSEFNSAHEFHLNDSCYFLREMMLLLPFVALSFNLYFLVAFSRGCCWCCCCCGCCCCYSSSVLCRCTATADTKLLKFVESSSHSLIYIHIQRNGSSFCISFSISRHRRQLFTIIMNTKCSDKGNRSNQMKENKYTDTPGNEQRKSKQKKPNTQNYENLLQYFPSFNLWLRLWILIFYAT